MTDDPVYSVPLVQERARDNATWRGVGTGVAVGAVGILLYLLIRNLGLGGRGGANGEGGRGVAAPPTLPMPKDEMRISFVMTQPTSDAPSLPMSFRGPDARAFALEEMIARVKAGGRSDVTLKATGLARQGSWMSALERVKQAGLEVWTEGASGTARVSGNGRGQYGSYV